MSVEQSRSNQQDKFSHSDGLTESAVALMAEFMALPTIRHIADALVTSRVEQYRGERIDPRLQNLLGEAFRQLYGRDANGVAAADLDPFLAKSGTEWPLIHGGFRREIVQQTYLAGGFMGKHPLERNSKDRLTLDLHRVLSSGEANRCHGRPSGDVHLLDIADQSGAFTHGIIDGVTHYKGADAELAAIDYLAAQTIQAALQEVMNTQTPYELLNTDFLVKKLFEAVNQQTDLLKQKYPQANIEEIMLRATAGLFFQPNRFDPSYRKLLLVGDVRAYGIDYGGDLHVIRDQPPFVDSFTGSVRKVFSQSIQEEVVRRSFGRKSGYDGEYQVNSLLLTQDRQRFQSFLGDPSKLLVDVPPEIVTVILTSDGMPSLSRGWHLPFFALYPFFANGQDLSLTGTQAEQGQLFKTAVQAFRNVYRQIRFLREERSGGAAADDSSMALTIMGDRLGPLELNQALTRAFFRSQDHLLEDMVNYPFSRFSRDKYHQTDVEYNADLLQQLDDVLEAFLLQKFGTAKVDYYEDLNPGESPGATIRYEVDDDAKNQIAQLREQLLPRILEAVFEMAMK